MHDLLWEITGALWWARVATVMLVAAVCYDVRHDIRRLISARNVVLIGIYMWYLFEALQGGPAVFRFGTAAYMRAVLLVVFAGACFLAAYHRSHARWFDRCASHVARLDDWDVLRRTLFIGAALGSIPLVAYGLARPADTLHSMLAMRSGQDGPLSRPMLGDFRASVLMLENFLFGVGWVAMLVLSHKHRTRGMTLLAVSVLAWYLVRSYGTGTRWMVFVAALVPVAWLYWRSSPKWQRRLAIAALPSVLVFYGFAAALAEGRDKGRLDFAHTPKYVGHEMFRELPFVLNELPARRPHLYGRTLLLELINPIPRFLWNDKPLGFGVEYATWQGEDPLGDGPTLSPGIIGQMYIDFGLVGILLLSVLGGVLCRAWDRIGRQATSLPVLMFYAVGLGCLMMFGRSLSITFLYPVFASLICITAARVRLPRLQRRAALRLALPRFRGRGNALDSVAVNGAAIVVGSKILNLAVSVCSLAVVARLLTPADFGLVAMVLSVTMFLMGFSDLGLSLVTVQRGRISHEQLSTLFWINAGFGVLLGMVAALLAPGLAWFYGDPRLLGVALALAAAFPIEALGVQHQAILKRNMRLGRLAGIRFAAAIIGATVSIGAACLGIGYWALVCQPLVAAVVGSVSVWALVRWRPAAPRRCHDLRAMLGFGGRLTGHGMMCSLSAHLDKILLGRFCGPFALGLYSTACRLVMQPIVIAGYSIGEAAIPAMSRTRHDPAAMRAVFRRTFSCTCLAGLPACVAGVLWADDIVLTLLGDQWRQATWLLRILFVAAVPRMLCASTAWVYVAVGRPERMLRWELAWSVLAVIAFTAGLPFGPAGVATAYAVASWIALGPCFIYCFAGTPFKISDVLRPAILPALGTFSACALAMFGQGIILPDADPGPIRLGVCLGIAAILYAGLVTVSHSRSRRCPASTTLAAT